MATTEHNESQLLIIAGPCSAESEEQTMATAVGVKAAGVGYFRAGLWKPRTRPGNFEGVGSKGLPWLQRVQCEVGLRVITEVATAEHLRLVSDGGLAGFWLGARTSANPFAVQEIADAFAELPDSRKDELLVIVKNPINPDLELWEGALERMSAAGAKHLIAAHRGFSAYGETIYRNSPMWRIPIELRRRHPELPLLCDPSHIAGRRELVAPICRQAMQLGIDGLIIESHSDPDSALSDAAQQLTPSALKSLLATIRNNWHVATNISESLLNDCRHDIDTLDNELMELLSKRMAIAREIGRIKQQHGMTVMQPERYKALIEQRIAESERLQLDRSFIRSVLAAIHEESVRQQMTLPPDDNGHDG